MARSTFLAAFILLIACSDETPLQPEAPSRSLGASYSVELVGGTIWDGAIYVPTGNWVICSPQPLNYHLTGYPDPIRKNWLCYDSTILETVPGGRVSLSATGNGHSTSLGSVDANWRNGNNVFDIPSGVTVTLTAEAFDPDGYSCHFTHWLDQVTNQYVFQTTIQVTGYKELRALFSCNSSGGPPGGGW